MRKVGLNKGISDLQSFSDRFHLVLDNLERELLSSGLIAASDEIIGAIFLSY